MSEEHCLSHKLTLGPVSAESWSSVSEGQCSFPVEFIVLERSFVLVSVGKVKDTLSISQVLCHFSLVYSVPFVGVGSNSGLLVLLELSLVDVTVWIGSLSVSMFEVTVPLTLVKLSVLNLKGANTMFLS